MASNKNYMLNDKFPKHIKNATSTSDGLMSAEDKSRMDELFEFGLLSPVTPDKDGIMTKEDKVKLDGIEEGANNYTHPDTHDASMIVQDSSYRFVTDIQINTWNAKASTALVTITSNGLMSKEDKKKLDEIEEGASTYVHPDDENTRHVTDVEKEEWNAKASTAVATTSLNGLMSKEDKIKLDNIEENANNYVHPNDENTRHVTDNQINIWNSKASTDVVTTTSNGLMISSDKTKLDGISENANNYVHPNDENTRHVTISQINLWNAKASTAVATQTANGLMSSSDKTKLDGIAPKANNYIHPNDENTRHVTDTQINTWNGKASTTVATQTTNGLMSKEDKIKLDSIDEVNGNYTHPATHPATMITEDITHRFVTDDQVTSWNAKASTDIATTTTNGLMSAEDKTKLVELETKLLQLEEKLKKAVFYA